MKYLQPVTRRIDACLGESERILPRLLAVGQSQLFEFTGALRAAILSTESGRGNLGVERAKGQASAERGHPLGSVFPDWAKPSEAAE